MSDKKEGYEFERKVMLACIEMENGDPLKDFLDQGDIEEAIRKLADIYTTILGSVEVDGDAEGDDFHY